MLNLLLMQSTFFIDDFLSCRVLAGLETISRSLQHRWQLFQRLFAAYHKSAEEINAEYQIITKAQENPHHFAPLYEKYYDAMFIYINRRVDDEDIAADLTAQVFFKSLKSIRSFQFRGLPFSAWLYKIALNEVNLFFKSQSSHQRAVSLKEHHIDLLFDEMQNMEPEMDKHELVSRLLQKLSSEDLQLLELRFFENRSFREMAYLLNLTEINAKIRTYRVIDKLKKHLKEMNLQ